MVVERLRENTIREVAKQTGISRAEVAIQTEDRRPPRTEGTIH
jgi:uncharacterized protein YidB (DUF937 family)